MKKRVTALLLMCIVVLGLTTLFPNDVYADGTVNISVKSVSGIVGDEVTVEVKATSDKKFYSDLSLSYDASVLQLLKITHGGEEIEYGGGGGTVRIVKESAVSSATWSIKFKLSKVGSSSVKVLGSSLFLDEEEGKLTASSSDGTVTINAPVNYSADNNLKSLEISPGKLTPDFSPDITNYTVSVDASCYKLTVNAVANDSKAKVGVAGTSIKEGENKTVITVTAENGSKKTYTLVVNKPVSAPQAPGTGEMKMCEYNGEHYFINEDYTLTQLPPGFERYEINYKGETMCVGKNAGGLSIMYLEHTITGVGSFFVYDTVKERFSPFIMVDQAQNEFIILDITDEMEKPSGFELVETEIAEQTVKAMKNGESEFYLFYGMNSKGATGWYSYDSKEGTIQRYSGVAPVINDSQGGTQGGDDETGDGSAKGDKWKDIAIAAIIVALAMFVMAIIFMAKASKANKGESHSEMLAAVAAAKAEAEAARKEAAKQMAGDEAEEETLEDDEEEEYEEDDEEPEGEFEDYDALDDVEDEDVLDIGELPEEDDGDVLLDGEDIEVVEIIEED